MITRREELPRLLNELYPDGVGAEIGVQKGVHAQNLCKWDFSELFLIDPWLSQGSNYIDKANVSAEEHAKNYTLVVEKFSHLGNVKIIRDFSVSASKKFPDEYFDFIYLDGRHDYEGVMQDLEHWYPKLKFCGMMAGHDYVNGDLKEGKFGVKTAVDEFYGRFELFSPLRVTGEKWPSWYFFKE